MMNKKDKSRLHECRVALYKAACPSSDFDWLVEQSNNPFFTQDDLYENFTFANFWLPREMANQIIFSIVGKKDFESIKHTLYITDMPNGSYDLWRKQMLKHMKDDTWFYQTFKDQLNKFVFDKWYP